MNKQETLDQKLELLQQVAQAPDPVAALSRLQNQHPELLDPLLASASEVADELIEMNENESGNAAATESKTTHLDVVELKTKLKSVWEVH